MSVAGTIATAAAPAVASSIGTGLFGWIGAKKAREFAKESATTAYQRDVEMWERANKYNAPAEQMERLKNAGLNPNLVYGNGGATGNTSTQTPKHQNYEQPVYTHKFPDLMQVMQMYQDIKGKELSNESQSIQNQFLNQLGHAKLATSQQSAIKGLQELGAKYNPKTQKTSYVDQDSKFLQQYQEQIKGKKLDNTLKNINVNFFKSIPKQYQFLIPLLLKVIK